MLTNFGIYILDVVQKDWKAMSDLFYFLNISEVFFLITIVITSLRSSLLSIYPNVSMVTPNLLTS